jgi:hypothetical protein
MPEQFALLSPQLLHLTDSAGRLYYGARQTWYEDPWQKKAGCGPTAAAHLAWYLAHTRPGCRQLVAEERGGQAGFLALMQAMWLYVTPGMMGVNSTDLFTEGFKRYAQSRGAAISARVLPVPPLAQRPSAEHLASFLKEALGDDFPVAFLNLSNGQLQNLDNWHWVTLVAFEPATFAATMYDDGRQGTLDMRLWLKTTLLGGGLVAMEAPAAPP